MTAIFISYRKEDSLPWAIQLRDHLTDRFGKRQVYFDVDSLNSGRWRPQIDQALASCRIVLVVIGPRWATTADTKGRSRLLLEDDVHRREIATALSRPDVIVVPVLVDGATIPTPADLPAELQGLLDCQFSKIGLAHERRVADLRRLTRMVDEMTGQRRLRLLAALVLTLIVGFAVLNTSIAAPSAAAADGVLAAALCFTVASWLVCYRMVSWQVKGAWMALLAGTLSLALCAGSVIRMIGR